jgi:hypothetical protein
VTLRLHQICYVTDDYLPEDFSQCLVFASDNLTQLESMSDVHIEKKNQLKLKKRF